MNGMRSRHLPDAATSHLTPERIAAFLAVSARKNFTQGAADLGLTQPAVSRQIAKLERSLEVRLFDRRGGRVRLTESGAALEPRLRRILGDLSRIAETVRRVASGAEGRLRVAASSTPGFYVVPTVLGAFRKERPGVELGFQVADSRRVLELLVADEADVGIVGGVGDDGSLSASPLCDDEIACYVARDHLLARPRSVSLAHLENDTLVTTRPGSATREAFLSRFTAAGGRPRRVIELACPEAVKAVVAAGLGVGVASRFGLFGDDASRFRILRVGLPPIRRKLYVVRYAGKRASASSARFEEILRGPRDP